MREMSGQEKADGGSNPSSSAPQNPALPPISVDLHCTSSVVRHNAVTKTPENPGLEGAGTHVGVRDVTCPTCTAGLGDFCSDSEGNQCKPHPLRLVRFRAVVLAPVILGAPVGDEGAVSVSEGAENPAPLAFGGYQGEPEGVPDPEIDDPLAALYNAQLPIAEHELMRGILHRNEMRCRAISEDSATCPVTAAVYQHHLEQVLCEVFAARRAVRA